MKIINKLKQYQFINIIGKFFINKLPHSGIAQGDSIDFASQIQGKRLALLLSIFGNIDINHPCFFSSGSFGDHVLHCSIIKAARANNEIEKCKIIYDEKYEKLYESYFIGVSNIELMPVIGYIASSIDAYFINSAEWLKGYFPLTPLLPIYYPIIPFMVEYHQSVTHPQAIASILGIKNYGLYATPTNYTELCNQVNSMVTKIFNGSNKYLVVAPSSNSIGTIPIEFWVDLINAIPRDHNIIVNIPDEHREHFVNTNAHIMHFEPHLAISYVDKAMALISAPSGLANMSKIFTSTNQLLVCDYRNPNFSERSGLTSKVPVELQHNQYLNNLKAEFRFIKYKSNHSNSDYIREAMDFIWQSKY